MAQSYSVIDTALPQRVAPAIRHIILPLDGSKLAERAVEPAIVLARTFRADVSLVRCYELAASVPSDNAAQAFLSHKLHMPLHVASLYLARVEETFHQHGIAAYSHLYQWAATSALQETTAHPPDALVVLATQPASADWKQLEGVAVDIMAEGGAPVLLLPADTHIPFANGALRGLRILAIGAQTAAQVGSYAHMLADTFHGTVAHGAVADIALRAGTSGADLVVLKASPQLDEAFGGAHALKSLLVAGLPVLVVP